MPSAFGPESKVREILANLGDRGKELLFKHGYDVGEGFTDVLSQYQTLEHAARTERLRDLNGLLKELNGAPDNSFFKPLTPGPPP